MSVLTKRFDRRQDAIITDCYVVMPDGFTDADGNRRYCKLKMLHGIQGQQILLLHLKLLKHLACNLVENMPFPL